MYFSRLRRALSPTRSALLPRGGPCAGGTPAGEASLQTSLQTVCKICNRYAIAIALIAAHAAIQILFVFRLYKIFLQFQNPEKTNRVISLKYQNIKYNRQDA